MDQGNCQIRGEHRVFRFATLNVCLDRRKCVGIVIEIEHEEHAVVVLSLWIVVAIRHFHPSRSDVKKLVHSIKRSQRKEHRDERPLPCLQITAYDRQIKKQREKYGNHPHYIEHCAYRKMLDPLVKFLHSFLSFTARQNSHRFCSSGLRSIVKCRMGIPLKESFASTTSIPHTAAHIRRVALGTFNAFLLAPSISDAGDIFNH
jgi:hypothetical protein